MSAATHTLETITERYRSAVEARDTETLAELYRADVLLDAHVPNWRFQLHGCHAVADYTGGALPGPGRFATFRAEPTGSGDLLVQFEWRQAVDDDGAVVRQLHLWRLDGGRIAEQTLFCAGVWGPRLQQQMQLHARLLRP